MNYNEALEYVASKAEEYCSRNSVVEMIKLSDAEDALTMLAAYYGDEVKKKNYGMTDRETIYNALGIIEGAVCVSQKNTREVLMKAVEMIKLAIENRLIDMP